MMLQSALLLIALAAPQGDGGDKVDFESEVLPVLQERCFDCHGTSKKKPKAGLRLDGAGWIRAGAKRGSVLEPGRASRSELFLRVALPADDLDVMPPDGITLTKDEIDALEKWINQGADFGDWTGAGGPAEATDTRKEATEPERIRIWRELGKSLQPYDTGKLKAPLRKVARIDPVFEGSPLLRVSFPSREGEVTDALLKNLMPAARHLGYLDLSRTSITDRAATSFANATSLTHLNLRSTDVGDASIETLANLGELRSLNLYATRVTDASIPRLAAFEKLQDLYLWQSEVTKAGIAELRNLRPDLKVRFDPGIPSGGR